MRKSTHNHIKITPVALRVVSIFRILFNGCGTVNTNWGVLCSVVTTKHIPMQAFLHKLSFLTRELHMEAVVSKCLFKVFPMLT